MAKRTPPYPEYPEWTTSRFWSFVRSTLRRAFTRWPPKYKVLSKARREFKGGGRQKWEYQCSQCEKWYPAKQTEVDHIIPCGSLTCAEDVGGFVTRLFVSEDKLRIVCKECHKAITKEQKENKK